MNKCRACRRPLTSEVSIRYGLGSVCLKRAVKAGTAPLEALTELSTEQRNRPKRTKSAEQLKRTDTKTLDLFDSLREAALDDLRKAVVACESVGVKVEYTTKDLHAG